MINVFITEDHPIVVDGIVNLINATDDIRIVGTALNADSCLHCIGNLAPNILLLDINLPDRNGIELCKVLHEIYPFIRIIALTGFKEFYYMQQMINNGASGYLLKNALPDEITEAIRSVYKGNTYFCNEVQEKLPISRERLFLTPRELDLLRLVVEGYTNKEIAAKLFLGVETVNSYRKNLLLKLGVKNTAAMVKLAILEKLV